MWKRHPVATVVAVALLARAFVAIGVFVMRDGSLFLDDAFYIEMADQLASGRATSWSAKTQRLFETTAAFVLPVAGLFALFGKVALLGQLVAAIFGSLAAGVTVALAMRVVAVRWAVGAGLIVALLPSQVLFSSLVLKDAAVWAALALAGLFVASWFGRPVLSYPLAGVVALIVLLAFLREHSVVIASWSLPVAVVLAGRKYWNERLLVAVIVAIFIPFGLGLGLGGRNLVVDGRAPAELRARNAKGAETAVVDPEAQRRDRSLGSDLAHLPRGVSVVLLEPFPWQARKGDALALAALESLLWYPLLALGLVGLVCSWRARARLAYAVVLGGAIVVVYALAEGNLGTAFRHRGEVVWIVAVLAAAGAERTARQISDERADGSDDTSVEQEHPAADPLSR